MPVVSCCLTKKRLAQQNRALDHKQDVILPTMETMLVLVRQGSAFRLEWVIAQMSFVDSNEPGYGNGLKISSIMENCGVAVRQREIVQIKRCVTGRRMCPWRR